MNKNDWVNNLIKHCFDSLQINPEKTIECSVITKENNKETTFNLSVRLSESETSKISNLDSSKSIEPLSIRCNILNVKQPAIIIPCELNFDDMFIFDNSELSCDQLERYKMIKKYSITLRKKLNIFDDEDCVHWSVIHNIVSKYMNLKIAPIDFQIVTSDQNTYNIREFYSFLIEDEENYDIENFTIIVNDNIN